MSRSCAAPGSAPTQHQQAIITHVSERVAVFGECPDDLSVEGALTELLASRCQYDLEPRNLAKYDPSRLKIVRGETVPRDLCNIVRPEVAGYVLHAGGCIELPLEMDRKACESGLDPPYWCPVLRQSRRTRLELYRRLVGVGVMSGRTSIKEEIGIFFVKKKNGGKGGREGGDER